MICGALRRRLPTRQSFAQCLDECVGQSHATQFSRRSPRYPSKSATLLVTSVRSLQRVGLVFLQLVQIVETTEEEQIGDLLDDLERVGDPAGPEGISDAIDLVLDLAGKHTGDSLRRDRLVRLPPPLKLRRDKKAVPRPSSGRP